MKLFKVYYCEDGDSYDYLTVGEDEETIDSVKSRELYKMKDKGCLYFFDVIIIDQIDGHKIIVK